MDNLHFHLVLLLAFVLIFLQKYAHGIKCFECYNCNDPGVAENNTCVSDGEYCVSSIVRKKGKGKDVIQVNRRCTSKDESILCMKHKQDIRCCRDHDLCNIEIPELSATNASGITGSTSPVPHTNIASRTRVLSISITKMVIIIAVPIIILIIAICVLIYVNKWFETPDQNIKTNPLMDSQPLSLKELYNLSQSASGSFPLADDSDDEGFDFQVFYSI